MELKPEGHPQDEPDPPRALPPPKTSTVTGDVDVYDLPGGAGPVVGMPSGGQRVTKNCPTGSGETFLGW